MKPSDYRAAMELIQEQREAALAELKQKEFMLMRKYAFSNNSIEVGSIIESENGDIIRVTKIKFSRNPLITNGLPCCVYIGDQLTRKLKPRVNPIELRLWQDNVKKVIGDE